MVVKVAMGQVFLWVLQFSQQ